MIDLILAVMQLGTVHQKGQRLGEPTWRIGVINLLTKTKPP